MENQSSSAEIDAGGAGLFIAGGYRVPGRRPGTTVWSFTASCCFGADKSLPKAGGRRTGRNSRICCFRSAKASRRRRSASPRRKACCRWTTRSSASFRTRRPGRYRRICRDADPASADDGHRACGGRDRQRAGGRSIGSAASSAKPVEHAPGTHFAYNSAATYMLSAILHKVTGPIPARLSGAAPVRSARHVRGDVGNLPARHRNRRLGTECDDRRYRQVRPAVFAARRWEGRADTAGGLGRRGDTPIRSTTATAGRTTGRRATAINSGAAGTARTAGDGAFGQFCIVMPEQEAVLAITSGVRRHAGRAGRRMGGAAAGVVFGCLGTGRSGPGGARRLASFRIDPPQAQPSSPGEAQLEGRIFHMDAFASAHATLSLTNDASAAVNWVRTVAAWYSRRASCWRPSLST